MKYAQLGKTGLRVSMVGFGGIPIGRLSRLEATKIVRSAIDLGINFFDTAKIYSDSEEKIGEGIAGCRSQVVIATKTMSRTRQEVAADIEQSLRRLRTDYIDLYQLHDVRSEETLRQVVGPGGAVEALHEAKDAGKIRHVGVTSHSRSATLKALPTGAFESVMIPFSYLEPEAGKEVLPQCQALGVGFICMKPFSGGAFTAPIQALKWVFQQGATVAMAGIGSLAELEEDAAVADMDWTLTTDEMALMEALKVELGRTFCRGCDYCQPCSSKIRISTVLRSTSHLRRMGPSWMANGHFEQIVDWVDSCIECHECESRCPYELPIPDLLRQRVGELRTGLRAAGWSV